ncbi:hypothetical protein [Flavobacterium sp.]|uniref:hypothetical protein n=1 Tax=Flavobacterium sp. TaxID=239 RepID=UPI00391D7819
MKTKIFSLFLGVITITLTSCETENSSEQSTTSRQNVPVANSVNVSELSPCTYTELIADQRYDAGDIKIYFDPTNVYVEYQASTSWLIRETHLFVGKQSMIPITRNGSPNTALFPVSETFQGGTEAAIYSFPRAGLPKCFTISAYAVVNRMQNGVVVQTESAWAEGVRFNQAGWGMFFDLCQSDCNN